MLLQHANNESKIVTLSTRMPHNWHLCADTIQRILCCYAIFIPEIQFGLISDCCSLWDRYCITYAI